MELTSVIRVEDRMVRSLDEKLTPDEFILLNELNDDEDSPRVESICFVAVDSMLTAVVPVFLMANVLCGRVTVDPDDNVPVDTSTVVMELEEITSELLDGGVVLLVAALWPVMVAVTMKFEELDITNVEELIAFPRDIVAETIGEVIVLVLVEIDPVVDVG
jgi:predicted anti-sigma-YlaC factor YlaD